MLDGFRGRRQLSEGSNSQRRPAPGSPSRKMEVQMERPCQRRQPHPQLATAWTPHSHDCGQRPKAPAKKFHRARQQGINLRIKADALGLQAEDYETGPRVPDRSLHGHELKCPSPPTRSRPFLQRGTGSEAGKNIHRTNSARSWEANPKKARSPRWMHRHETRSHH